MVRFFVLNVLICISNGRTPLPAQERIKPTVIAPQALTSQDQNVAGPDLQQIPRVEFNVESEVARFV